jgi:hypothetical protein
MLFSLLPLCDSELSNEELIEMYSEIKEQFRPSCMGLDFKFLAIHKGN